MAGIDYYMMCIRSWEIDAPTGIGRETGQRFEERRLDHVQRSPVVGVHPAAHGCVREPERRPHRRAHGAGDVGFRGAVPRGGVAVRASRGAREEGEAPRDPTRPRHRRLHARHRGGG